MLPHIFYPSFATFLFIHLFHPFQVELEYPADVKFMGTPYFADFLRARGMLKAPRYRGATTGATTTATSEDVKPATIYDTKQRRHSEDTQRYMFSKFNPILYGVFLTRFCMEGGGGFVPPLRNMVKILYCLGQ